MPRDPSTASNALACPATSPSSRPYLRRTARTMMSRLAIPEDIAELAISHQRADLVARYNKDQAWPARVEAFEKVSAHMSALLAEAGLHHRRFATRRR